MATRYIPSDLDQLHQNLDSTKELVTSLEKIVTGYPPKDSYDSYECHGLYSGPTSIAYLFFCLSRTHPHLSIRGQIPELWARAYLHGKRNFLPATVDKNGVGNETLAFHAVKAVTMWDLDDEKLRTWMEPVYNSLEGKMLYILTV